MRDGVGDGRFGLLGAVIDEARGEKERLGGLAEAAARDAAVDQQRGGTEGEGIVASLGLSHAAGGRVPAEGSAVGCLRTQRRGPL